MLRIVYWFWGDWQTFLYDLDDDIGGFVAQCNECVWIIPGTLVEN